MELQSDKIVALIVVAVCFVGSINCACIVGINSDTLSFWYHCVGSVDYASDVTRAPIDVPHVTFSISNIPVLPNGVLTRLAKNLTMIDIQYSKVKEIEDNALQGLSNLLTIDLAGNELEVIKAAPFRGLSNLKYIKLSNNRIRQIEDSFFSTVSPLRQLHIDYNKLTCISGSLLSDFNAKALRYEYNPWSWKCLNVIQDWLKEKKVQYDVYSYDGWNLAQNVTKNCVATYPGPDLDDSFINECVRTTLLQWTPDVANYTVRRICLIREHPTPFLGCGY